MEPSHAEIAGALERHFGFAGFRPGQEAVVRSVLAGKPTVAVMPTGAGKSLCYQLPALLLPGTALIVSPLVALMKDQVDSLSARGIPATFINSSIDDAEKARRLDAVRRGAFKLVYVAPERFRSAAFVEAIREIEISLYAVDEAHCISQWGHDFRPDYTRLGQVRWVLRPPRTLALTATATPEVRDDIVRVLRLKDPKVSVAGFDRPNLFFEVAKVANEHEKLGRIVRSCRDGGGVVYCATRRDVEKVAGMLDGRGIRSFAYHAGMGDDDRRRIQDAFMAQDDAVVCATNAFGMGVDKPTIRFVAHFAIPKAIEAYYQEAGRAGRDGRPARAVLLFNHADVYLQERLVEANHPSAAMVRDVWKHLRTMGDGELPIGERQVAAAVSASPLQVGSAIKHLERAGHLQRSARGLVVLEPGLEDDELRVDFDGIAARRQRELQMVRRMSSYAYHEGCRRSYLLHYFGDEPVPCSGCDVCNGPSEPPVEELAPAPASRRGRKDRPTAANDEGPYDGEVFAALKELRLSLAKAEGVPPYVVFHDRALRAFARALPQTEEAFLSVAGAGPTKWERYGPHILATISQARRSSD
ncbi:RecQ family ATP-dependent DNA helicase [Vulgatibacter incomptus]|uniref:ATP-dependent DNA helicase RecQ n=1 Tax=Vulgatibacter incomptus TaxID=1391653 RepID=A0A0K1PF53_9BACT|nr:ATP-dependent DNA helicase RecQ [Vulgatibacter incomptus]AKU92150.1 ATP-dependent DNA helicase RecQ [Vulgatibacter incomptus]